MGATAAARIVAILLIGAGCSDPQHPPPVGDPAPSNSIAHEGRLGCGFHTAGFPETLPIDAGADLPDCDNVLARLTLDSTTCMQRCEKVYGPTGPFYEPGTPAPTHITCDMTPRCQHNGGIQASVTECTWDCD